MSEDNKALIDEIVGIEWEMFHTVNNIGGTADCQNQPETFDIMRRSNLMTWPEELLYSYRSDLVGALQAGHNMMTEKYARMMKATSPEEYENLKRFLPFVTARKQELVDSVANILALWEESVRKRYPFISQNGRQLMHEGEGPGTKTSFETYVSAELATYSENTLSLYYDHVHSWLEQGINGSERVYENMVKLYGYASLEEANAILSN